MVFWSNTNFIVATHELGHCCTAAHYGASNLLITIDATGGLAEWQWINHTPSPQELITIAAAGYQAERLIKHYEPTIDTHDEAQIAVWAVGLTDDEVQFRRRIAAALVHASRDWILSNARRMGHHGVFAVTDGLMV